MAAPAPATRILRFGAFEVDLVAGELRKQGVRVKLQEQPFQILARLLERPGELVTREDLRERLWPSDTFVDFDNGLNAAISKLRQALGDTAENPRFLETLARRGYRFLVPVEKPGPTPSPAATLPEPSTIPPRPPVPRRWLGSTTRLWLTIALAGLAVAVAATSWWLLRRKSAPISIAVLPLTNLSQDPANDYFADGLTGEIIRNLSLIDGLAVRSQTSSFVFKGKTQKLREAGKQLAADYILEGSVLRANQQLRINAQFIRVRDDFPLWTGKYDRALTDVFAIQDEISRAIVNSLRLKLGRGRRRYETSPEAYDLYLRARALEIHSGMPAYHQSVGPFEEAIAKDPSFAPAYAGLAAAHAARSGWFRLDPADEAAKMRAAAEKAIQLDPLLAEAHDALGMAYARDAQWEQSEKSFRRAIELDPNRSEAHRHFAGFVLWPLGRIEEALQQLRVAESTDRLSPEVHFNLAYVLIAAGRYDEAAGHCEKLPSEFWARSECLGRARLGQGRIEEAIQVLATAFHRGVEVGSEVRGSLGYAYARAGRREEAEKLAAASPLNPFNQAVIFAGLGDKDRAWEALDRAAMAGPVRMGWALAWPEYGLLRGDPRMKALRLKAGLPE